MSDVPDRVPIHCTWCRDGAPVTVLHVVDGPGLQLRELRPEDATSPADVCGTCPKCGREKCLRVLHSAA